MNKLLNMTTAILAASGIFSEISAAENNNISRGPKKKKQPPAYGASTEHSDFNATVNTRQVRRARERAAHK